MANVIDITYFFGEIAVGQLSETSVQAKLNIFISKYEAELLEGILGYVSYKDFIANTGSTKWTDLLNGKEYTDDYNLVRKWKGLKITTGILPQSLIACYVYYRYQRSYLTSTAGIGEVKTHAENSAAASPKFKMVNAWNIMVDDVEELYAFMRANKSVYNDWYDWASLTNTNVKFLTRINHHGL